MIIEPTGNWRITQVVRDTGLLCFPQQYLREERREGIYGNSTSAQVEQQKDFVAMLKLEGK